MQKIKEITKVKCNLKHWVRRLNNYKVQLASIKNNAY